MLSATRIGAAILDPDPSMFHAGESLYCHECRVRKPKVVMGKLSRIEPIRAALAAGDLVLAHELVRRVHDPVLPQGGNPAEVSTPVPCGAVRELAREPHDGRPLKTTSPAGVEAGTYSKTTVVHCKREKHDVYIGRPSPWGNPFKLEQDTDEARASALKQYEAWLVEQPHLMGRLDSLRGKTLGCWCAPKACHGDVLARLADELSP